MKLFDFKLKAITDDDDWKEKLEKLPDDLLELLHKKGFYLLDVNIEVKGNQDHEKKLS